MERTVVALFDDVNIAHRALQELLNNGFDRNDISVVRTNQQMGTTAGSTTKDPDATDTSATAAGAGIGAVLGGIAGLVVGLGALAIPGIGPIVAAGPLAAALAGAGVGAATGGVVGALADAGIPETEAVYYEEGIRRGGTLLAVQTNESNMSRATQILNSFSPVDIDHRVAEWRSSGWSGFQSTGSQPTDFEPTDFESTGYERTRSERASFETDARWSTGAYTRRFEDFEDEFHNDFETRYGAKGIEYEKYRPAYQYGWEAHNLFGGRDWKAIEPELRADWQKTHLTDAWEDVKDAIRTGWERFQYGVQDVSRDVERGFDRTAREMSRDFDAYDLDFRNDWDTNYRTSTGGYGYERYRPAYQYGYTLATERRYRGRAWDEIEMDARRDWEMQHPSDAWEDFKDAVRHAWQRVRADVRDAVD